MVPLTLKVILHVQENDSKYRDVAHLKSRSQIFKYNISFLVPVYLTMLKIEQCFLIMIHKTNKQTNKQINKQNKTKENKRTKEKTQHIKVQKSAGLIFISVFFNEYANPFHLFQMIPLESGA